MTTSDSHATPPTGKPSRRWYRPALHRVRLFSTVLAVVLCSLIAVSSRYEIRAWYIVGAGTNYQLGLSGGTATAYWGAEPGFSQRTGRLIAPGFTLTTDKRWEDNVSLAWRPYHVGARRGFNAGDTHHGFALPLWLIAVPVAIAAAYTHGLLVGMRRADKSRCAKCGYDRTGLMEGAACPECGRK